MDSVLANNLNDLAELFTDKTNGIAKKLGDYLEKTIGDEGTLIKKQDNLTKQAFDIDQQVADLERLVQSSRSRLIDSFVSMETAQASIKQQTQFLSQRLGLGNA